MGTGRRDRRAQVAVNRVDGLAAGDRIRFKGLPFSVLPSHAGHRGDLLWIERAAVRNRQHGDRRTVRCDKAYLKRQKVSRNA